MQSFHETPLNRVGFHQFTVQIDVFSTTWALGANNVVTNGAGGWGGGIMLSEEHYSVVRGFPTPLLGDTVYTYPSASFRLHMAPSVTRTRVWHRPKANSRLTNISKLNLYLSNTWFTYGCHT